MQNSPSLAHLLSLQLQSGPLLRLASMLMSQLANPRAYQKRPAGHKIARYWNTGVLTDKYDTGVSSRATDYLSKLF